MVDERVAKMNLNVPCVVVDQLFHRAGKYTELECVKNDCERTSAINVGFMSTK